MNITQNISDSRNRRKFRKALRKEIEYTKGLNQFLQMCFEVQKEKAKRLESHNN